MKLRPSTQSTDKRHVTGLEVPGLLLFITEAFLSFLYVSHDQFYLVVAHLARFFLKISVWYVVPCKRTYVEITSPSSQNENHRKRTDLVLSVLLVE